MLKSVYLKIGTNLQMEKLDGDMGMVSAKPDKRRC